MFLGNNFYRPKNEPVVSVKKAFADIITVHLVIYEKQDDGTFKRIDWYENVSTPDQFRIVLEEYDKLPSEELNVLQGS